MFLALWILFFTTVVTSDPFTWTALDIILGENAYDNRGSSIAFSENGYTIIVGDPQFANFNGRAEVFKWNSTTSHWTQEGSTYSMLHGTMYQGGLLPLMAGGEKMGGAVAINAAGTVVAIGAQNWSTPAVSNINGAVFVLEYDSQVYEWKFKGSVIEGHSDFDYFGAAVSLDGLGNTVAGSAIYSPTRPPYVNICQYSAGDWVCKSIAGSISGGGISDMFGMSLSLSSNGLYLIVGSPHSLDPLYPIAVVGAVCVFKNAMDWSLYGPCIYGLLHNDNIGVSVDISSNGETIIIGCPDANSGKGLVYVYAYDYALSNYANLGFSGSFINQFGISVQISDAGDWFVVGTQTGQSAYVFYYDGLTFTLSTTLSAFPSFGTVVAISGDGKMVGVSAPVYDEAGLTDRGVVYTYVQKYEPSSQPTGQPSMQPSLQPSSTPSYVSLNEHSQATWELWGSEIIGTEYLGQLGLGLALNAKGNVVIVGIPYGMQTGGAQIYIYSELLLSWEMAASTIIGWNVGDNCGYSVAINDEGDTFAIGCPLAEGLATGVSGGRVMIYTLNGNDLEPQGTYVAGHSDSRLGNSIVMNNDGSVVAMSAPMRTIGSFSKSGSVAVYDYIYSKNSSASTNAMKGSEIYLPGGFLQFSLSDISREQMVALNDAGNIVAISAVKSLSFLGRVAVYRFNTTTSNWAKLGNDLYGSISGEGFGAAVALNGAGYVLAVGSLQISGNHAGYATLYRYSASSNTWVQWGNSITGPCAYAEFGSAISLNRRGDVVAISAPVYAHAGVTVGLVQVYGMDRSIGRWVQLGQNLTGYSGDLFGKRVSLNAAGDIVAISSPFSKTIAGSAGKVGVYRLLNAPSSMPSRQPTSQPSRQPSLQPSVQPSSAPSLEVALMYDSMQVSQLGSSMTGESKNEYLGMSLDMSEDGTMAIAGIMYFHNSTGVVRVFRYTSDWSLVQSIVGPFGNISRFGVSLAMSDDGSMIVAGAPEADSAINKGAVAVYRYIGSEYQFLTVLYGLDSNDGFGMSVALSGNGNYLAVMAPYADSVQMEDSGAVYVYRYSAGGWIQLGSKIEGVANYVQLRRPNLDFSSLALTDQGTVIVGYPYATTYSIYEGIVCIYDLYGSAWQISAFMEKNVTDGLFGIAVAASADGSTIAISSQLIDNAGECTVYYNSGTNIWIPKGDSFTGIPNSKVGRQVSLNRDGSVVAIFSVPVATFTSAGCVSIYAYQRYTNSWNLVGNPVYGTANGDLLGYRMVMNKQATRVAASSPSYNKGAVQNTGLIKVFAIVAAPSSFPSGQPSREPSTQPTVQPSAQPTLQPAARPTAQPSCQPSIRPTAQPTCQPSRHPSCQPSNQPTSHPSTRPSRHPTTQPSSIPSLQPTGQPSIIPSLQPTGQPSSIPSLQPSALPSLQPSARPTMVPSSPPSSLPSCQPTGQPSTLPTDQPTSQPSIVPTGKPSSAPSTQPSMQPTTDPTLSPTSQPSQRPFSTPSSIPTSVPTNSPSFRPSGQPSGQPTAQPKEGPTSLPSSQPSSRPTLQDTSSPTTTPTTQPSHRPTSAPSMQPSRQPSHTPSSQPTRRPSQASRRPSATPSAVPTRPSSEVGAAVSSEWSIPFSQVIIHAKSFWNTSNVQNMKSCQSSIVYPSSQTLTQCRWSLDRSVVFLLPVVDVVINNVSVVSQQDVVFSRVIVDNSVGSAPYILHHCYTTTCKQSLLYETIQSRSPSRTFQSNWKLLELTTAKQMPLRPWLTSFGSTLLPGTRVCNVYQRCQATGNRTRTLGDSLTVQIRYAGVATATLQMRADEEIVLNAELLSFQVINRSATFQYSWHCHDANNQSQMVWSEIVQGHSLFRIPKNTLYSGRRYAIQLVVVSASLPLRTANASLLVHCLETALILRTNAHQNQVVVPMNLPSQINMSAIDTNHYDSPDSWRRTRYNFTYQCLYAIDFAMKCPVSLQLKFLSRESIPAYTTYRLSLLVRSIVAEESECTVQLTVSYTGVSGAVFTSTQYVRLRVVSRWNSNVLISLGSATRVDVHRASSVWELQSASSSWKAVLQGNASVCDWALVYPRYEHQSYVSMGAIKTQAPIPVAFPAGTMIPPSSLMVFRLSCDANYGRVATAEVDIYINNPPYGGTLSVSPSSGVALSSLFALEAPGWKDESADDYPLQYMFQIDGTRRRYLPSHILEPFVSDVILAEDISDSHNVQTVLLTVQDGFGGRTSLDRGVTVELVSAWAGTTAFSTQFWQNLKWLLSASTPAATSTVSTFADPQRLVAVMYMLTELMTTLNVAKVNATQQQNIFGGFHEFSIQVLRPLLNSSLAMGRSVYRGDNISLALANEGQILASLDTTMSVLQAYVLLQQKRSELQGDLSSVLGKLSAPPFPIVGNGSSAPSINTAAALLALQYVQNAVQSLSPAMVGLLMSHAWDDSNAPVSVSSPTILQNIILIQELVKVTMSVVAIPLPPPSKANTSMSFVIPSDSSSNTTVAPNTIAIKPPSVAMQTNQGIVGVLVSVVEVPPALLSSKGLVTVNQSSSGMQDASATANLVNELERPKLVSDVITLQISLATQNGSTVKSVLPEFQLNLSLVLPSTGDLDGLKPSGEPVLSWLEHNCTRGKAETVSIRCSQSRVQLNVTCSGTADSIIRRQCPVSRTVCSVLDLEANRVVSNDYCVATVVGSSVQCKCGIDQTNTNTTNSILALKGRITVAAFSSFVAGDLDSSVAVSAVGLSGDIATQSAAVLATFCCLWGVGLLFMGIQVTWRADSSVSRKMKGWWSAASGITMPSKVAALSVRNVPSERELFLHYVLDLLPPIYKPGVEWWKALWTIVSENHPYLRLWTWPSPQSHRSSRAQQQYQKKAVLQSLQILTGLTMSCFVLAVLYDLQYPVDDGYCASQSTDQATCEYRKTMLDPWQSRCTWSPPPQVPAAATISESLYGKVVRSIDVGEPSGDDGVDDPSCVWNSSNNSTVAFVISFAITLIFSAIFEFASDAVFSLFWMSASELPSSFLKHMEEESKELAHTLQETELRDVAARSRRKFIHAVQQSQRGKDEYAPVYMIRGPDCASDHAPDADKATIPMSEPIVAVSVLQWTVAVVTSHLYPASTMDNGASQRRDAKYLMQLMTRTMHRTNEVRASMAATSSLTDTGAMDASAGVGEKDTTTSYQYLGCVCVLAMNVGAMYFIVLKSVMRGYAWQIAYLQVCVWEWFTDVWVLALLEIWLLDFYIPSYWKSVVFAGLRWMVSQVHPHHHHHDHDHRLPAFDGPLDNVSAAVEVAYRPYLAWMHRLQSWYPQVWELYFARARVLDFLNHPTSPDVDGSGWKRIPPPSWWGVLLLRGYMCIQSTSVAVSLIRFVMTVAMSLLILFFYSTIDWYYAGMEWVMILFVLFVVMPVVVPVGYYVRQDAVYRNQPPASERYLMSILLGQDRLDEKDDDERRRTTTTNSAAFRRDHLSRVQSLDILHDHAPKMMAASDDVHGDILPSRRASPTSDRMQRRARAGYQRHHHTSNSSPSHHPEEGGGALTHSSTSSRRSSSSGGSVGVSTSFASLSLYSSVSLYAASASPSSSSSSSSSTSSSSSPSTSHPSLVEDVASPPPPRPASSNTDAVWSSPAPTRIAAAAADDDDDPTASSAVLSDVYDHSRVHWSSARDERGRSLSSEYRLDISERSWSVSSETIDARSRTSSYNY